MTFDGLFTHAMIHELNQTLQNGRVTKISQPYPNEVILTIRANRTNYPVLLSANPRYARFQITQIPYTNPAVPTNFTMMLRKYLEGAKLLEIKQLDNDRVVYFEFLTRNELGDKLPLLLSAEIMGRYSNVILINQSTNKIIDTIKHVGMDQNRYRTLLPGATYRQPPTQNKENPFEQDSNTFEKLIQKYPNREVLADNLLKQYQGISRDNALALADKLHTSNNSVQAFNDFLAMTEDPIPTMNGNNFSIFADNPNDKKFTTLSEMLDVFYHTKANRDRVQQQGGQLLHVIRKNLQRNKKKLKKLSNELKATENADEYRIKGEVLTTYLYQIKRGMTKITLPNFYDNNKEITISLSNQLSPSQNAQKYFKKYQKLKNAVTFVNEQIELTKKEVAYLEEIQTQIELATPADLDDIKTELQQEGYIKKKQQKSKRSSRVKINKPESFIASDGTEILVGKNNLQNEKLTLHTAKKTDIWLHAKNIPGSHVIIKSNNPSDETLFEAAMLAAYFSKFRSSANVPIDYVQVKNIRKPNGSKPGFVIYEGQKTLTVTPTEDFVLELRQNKK
ncbi:NFACT RNA binding domain-containing protein [Ligilactobacillus salivarius]|uniref:Rqc2 homolog RqcH n=1 Tax=Ligilactobacillus salivarius TaxID=1624 RepID=A0ABD7YWY6_9LACO|nr:NFACT RNA binding domain-containing protein [Ligilactobacillus salivarius]WHS06690.1 NFACT RNA binding domain-containing protein [Ligilactobacillus salivarius]WHS07225.1 NFACT RNA binding domain-containing protein [Ligilactobacillus salivarius]WHS14593.1 NFACT RNA binding domain-containing protein [Ligilactobacillus salivarius]WHS18507.1 NFACT RNA binding domain-containing protein [Ligilactobacillus salivarius]WHS19984.1 NFACT RNA binding domain-containing protein [Ligilactobacillus salivar